MKNDCVISAYPDNINSRLHHTVEWDESASSVLQLGIQNLAIVEFIRFEALHENQTHPNLGDRTTILLTPIGMLIMIFMIHSS